MRYAICNETFEGWEHRRVCRLVADLGYGGLEDGGWCERSTSSAAS